MKNERKSDFCTSCRIETSYKMRKKIVPKVMKDKKFSENVIGNYQDSERYYKNETFKAYIKDILEYCTVEYYRGR